jgi:hypothetical protein
VVHNLVDSEMADNHVNSVKEDIPVNFVDSVASVVLTGVVEMSNCNLFVVVVEVNCTYKASKVFELVEEVMVVVVYSHNLN